MSLFVRDVAPTIEVEETDFGLRIYSVRQTGPDAHYVRISNFVLPNLACFPGKTEGDGYSDSLARPDRRHPPLEVRGDLPPLGPARGGGLPRRRCRQP